ncbi:MAG: hypothetical protein JXR63_00050 [Spirochaetales bacterium]|nr:hypothetical protein [Spirochaetales bacterium]
MIKIENSLKKHDLKLYNVSFGIFLFLPPGWFVIFFVLVLESFFMSKYLEKTIFDKKITLTAILSNLISGAFGVIASMAQNGGWWLVWWFPWVSKNEVKFDNIGSFVLYFFVALILSIIIELAVNLILLHKRYKVLKIVLGTLFANLISNGIVIFFMYLLSFVFLKE